MDDAETVERLRAEIAELRESRQRLVAAADADRSRLERELHDGVQQHLVALAVKLQLSDSSEPDAVATKSLIDELADDVKDAIDAAAQLAQRIHAELPPGGLAVGLRAAAVGAGITASVDVAEGSSCPPAVARTIYLCWLEALGRDGATIVVRDEGDAFAFEIAATGGSDSGFERLRDRVEALGGRLTVSTHPGGRAHVSASIPL